MLVLDARAEQPRYAITLTTSDPNTPAALYREASAAVWKRLRRRYGRVEYYGHIEFTTGRAARSGGHRRLHGHYLVKFRDCDPDVIEVERLVRETWEAVTGAFVVEVAALVSPGAAIGYLSLHHRKPQQAPPKGWRGMVGRPSKGYFVRPVVELREQARAELRAEAVAWRSGISVELAALEVAARPVAEPIRVREAGGRSRLVEPLGPLHGPVSTSEGWHFRRGLLVNATTGEALDARAHRAPRARPSGKGPPMT